jgi:DNA-directed RNA polymerase specialized sigma24 family protein
MLLRFFVVLILISSSFRASAQYQSLLHKSFAERYVALDTSFYNKKIMQLDSAAMFAALKKMAVFAKANHDEELLLETCLMKNLYDMVGPQQNHRRGEVRMLELREIADNKKILHLQIRTREKLGYYYFHIAHNYGPAFENYLRAFELVKNVPTEDYPEKQELIANIGSAYFNFGDNINARKYYAIAQQVPASYKKRFPINLQNTLGLIYRAEHKYLQADKYFRKAFGMAQTNHDSTWMGIAAGNLGISYFHQQKFQEAIPLLALDVRQSILANEIDNALSSLIFLIKINQMRNNLAEVARQVDKARKLLPSTGSPQFHLRELYPIMANLQVAKGNYYLAYRYTDSAGMMKDSLYNRRNASLLAGTEKKIEIEKYLAQVERLEAQEKFRDLWLLSLLVGLLLLIVIAYLIINRQRLLHRQKQLQLQAEKESVELELREATLKLNDFTNRIREKRKLIEHFEAELNKNQTVTINSDSETNNEVLLQLQQATILTDQQWEDFRQAFEKVHKGYMQRLKEKIPGLSPAETRFMVLSKLGFSNKEMAATLGISTEAIRLTRHRLRKKLVLPKAQSLEELVESV